MVARRAHNPKVTGSSPVPATREPSPKVEGFFMHCVYVLYSSKWNRLYIGETSDLISRISSHNELGTKGFTLRYRPWKVIHVEFVKTRTEALVREKFLKSGKGREWIRGEILPQYLG